jgi:two-component system phosphate regulon sensor histidine kinase PhoR
VLRIHQLFFLNFLGLFVGTLLLASVVGYQTLKGIIIERNGEYLKNNIAMLALRLDAAEDLDRYAHEIREATEMRVTIVDKNGLVIAESDFDKSGMESHANRIEIMQAARNGFGITTRYSYTLKTDFLYVAKKITYRDRPVYLRLSMSLSHILHNFYTITLRMLLIFLFFIVIALFISYKMSKKIHYDIVQIVRYLEEISNKNYKAVIKTKYFTEFLQISLQLKNLAKKLHTRDKQKRKYTARLRLINKQRNDILSAISHEFKNPIASIMGYTETLQDDQDLDPKIRTKFLEKILANAKKITTMLDRLSLSVKLENEDLKITPTAFDLGELSQDVVSNLAKKYRDRTIRFEGESRMVFADKTMIELVLTNLIDNAMKYSEEEVAVAIAHDRLTVTDKGMGIPKKEIDKITSKFYRIEKNTWDNSMGLGLAIVTYILRLHKTELFIESMVGEGSVFGFRLNALTQKEPSGKQ